MDSVGLWEPISSLNAVGACVAYESTKRSPLSFIRVNGKAKNAPIAKPGSDSIIDDSRGSEGSEMNNPSVRGFLHCDFRGKNKSGFKTPNPASSYEETDVCREFDDLVVDESRSTEERIQAVRDLFADRVRAARLLETGREGLEGRCNLLAGRVQALDTALTQVKASVSHESDSKQKLQALCSELQKQGKLLQEETSKVSQEEESKRNELQTKFDATMRDIAQQLEAQAGQRGAQAQENAELRAKLEAFAAQYEARARHLGAQRRTRELEAQLLAAQRDQQARLAAQEEGKAAAFRAHLAQLAATEAELRGQLALYAEKFDQFQEALRKSNAMFAQFKEKMAAMAETIARLEAENAELRQRGGRADVALIAALDARTQARAGLADLRYQKSKLEVLCRTMQTERTKKHAREARALERQIGRLERGEPPGAADDEEDSEEEDGKKPALHPFSGKPMTEHDYPRHLKKKKGGKKKKSGGNKDSSETKKDKLSFSYKHPKPAAPECHYDKDVDACNIPA